MKTRNPNNVEVRQRCLTTQLLHNPMMMACEHCGKRNRFDVPTSSATTKCSRCGHAAFLPKNKCDEVRCENARLAHAMAMGRITQDESEALDQALDAMSPRQMPLTGRLFK